MDKYINLFRFLSGYIMDFNSACDDEKESVLSRLEDAVTTARFFNESIIMRHDLQDGNITTLLMFFTITEENGDINWVMFSYDDETLEYCYYSRGMKYEI